MKDLTRKLMRLLTLGLVAILLGACGQEPPVMRIGTNVWPGYEPLYLARDLGLLDEQRYRLVEFSNNSQSIAAYRNGTLEAAALTLDEVLLLAQDGFDPQLVLVMDISHGGDVIIGRPEIAELKDLKGRRVGVENNALGAYTLSRALDLAGLKPIDVEVRSFTIDQHERALTEGKVDAVVTFEPVRTRLLAAGNRQLFDSTQIPGEIVDVLVVRKDFLQQHPERARELLQQWFKALDHLRQHPRDAAQHMAKRQQITPTEVLESYEGLILPDRDRNRRLLGNDGQRPELEATAKRLASVMYRDELLKTDVDVSRLFPANEAAGR
jgi:NitT/TauT family transport system substrate-binding protein